MPGVAGVWGGLKRNHYGVIYADPPWSFRLYSGADTIPQRAWQRRYDPMPTKDIMALPVHELAADDCALILWAIGPLIPAALQVGEAWGFEYKTDLFYWAKPGPMGMGYYSRKRIEPCYLFTKGKPLRMAKDVDQCIVADRREHSRKPDEAAAEIERMFAGPYLELFARERKTGWDAWGNQVGILEDAE